MWWISRSEPTATRSLTKPTPVRSSSGSSVVTYVPSPTRDSSTPTSASARTASRSELRERPKRCVNSRSVGSRAPAVNSPELIRSLIFAMAWSVARPTLMARR